MKVWQYWGKEDLRFVDVPDPVCGDDEIIMKIKSVGICGTDLHIYSGGMDVPVPIVPGHEFVGTVHSVGKNVSNFKVGDRVTAEHVSVPPHDYYATLGRKNLSRHPQVIGMHRNGALAELMSIPADLVYKIPDDMGFDEGVLVEPLSIAVYAVNKIGVRVGDKVGVIGQGPIGLFVDAVARTSGATVYGIDVMEGRLKYALEHDLVDEIVNSKNEDPNSALARFGFPDGFDVVFECVGREQTMNTAISIARPGGKIGVLGVFEKPVSLNFMPAVKKELEIIGSWTCVNSFESTIQLLASDKIHVDDFITHRYPFENAKQAFIDAASYSDNRIKSVIELP